MVHAAMIMMSASCGAPRMKMNECIAGVAPMESEP